MANTACYATRSRATISSSSWSNIWSPGKAGPERARHLVLGWLGHRLRAVRRGRRAGNTSLATSIGTRRLGFPARPHPPQVLRGVKSRARRDVLEVEPAQHHELLRECK